MGGNIELLNERTVCGEAVADISAKTSNLHGTVINGDIIPKLIDEMCIRDSYNTFYGSIFGKYFLRKKTS